MTPNQVLSQVTALISEGRVTFESAFLAALNTALDEIGQLFPKRACEVICHALPTPLLASDKGVTVTEGTPFSLAVKDVGGLALSLCGKGSLILSLNGKTVYEAEIQEGEAFVFTKSVRELFLEERADLLLTLTASPKLFLSSYACYRDSHDGLPLYAAYYRYPVSAFRHRFLAFTERVKLFDRPLSKHSRDLVFDYDALQIAFEKDGLYEVEYLALPDPVGQNDKNKALFLREDAAVLLPLLTAYYYALEDGDDMAQDFLVRYEALKGKIRQGTEERVDDVYGW